MRIGTWNLAGRWTPEHEALLLDQQCDVWLLTEVSDRVTLPGWQETRTTVPMAQRRQWAGVFATGPLEAAPQPHPATAAAQVGGLLFLSSVLPWRSCGTAAPWSGATHAEKTHSAVDAVRGGFPSGEVVWGGDWNHALDGTEYAGSQGGRRAVLAAVEQAGLQVPTASLPHRLPGCLSIDHVAVPASWTVKAEHVPAEGLSDHDAYVVEVLER